jgi:hypothetical protein
MTRGGGLLSAEGGKPVEVQGLRLADKPADLDPYGNQGCMAYRILSHPETG